MRKNRIAKVIISSMLILPLLTSVSEAATLNSYEKQVIDLTNKARGKSGLKPLAVDSKLTYMAEVKSMDMYRNGYFDHTSPYYGSPFDMMKRYNISYRYAGENIAKGQQTPQEVVNAWMNSEGHRRNILSKDFTHISVGYVSGYKGKLWSQEFIGK